MVGSETLGQFELSVVNIDGNDGGCPGQLRAGNGRVTHAPAAEYRHAVAAAYTAPVLMAAPIPAITPQPSRPAAAGEASGSTLVH